MTVTPKQRIDVSAEMLCFVGAGALPLDGWPAYSLLIRCHLGDGTPLIAFSIGWVTRASICSGVSPGASV